MACQKHYLIWTRCSFKAVMSFIATSFLGVAKSVYAFFVYTKLWLKRKNPLDYLSLFLSFSVKFSQTCQGITQHRAVFFHWLLLSPRPCHAVDSKPYCQEQQQLYSLSFSRLHKHARSYILHGCVELQDCLTVNVQAGKRREKNNFNSFYSNQTSVTWI